MISAAGSGQASLSRAKLRGVGPACEMLKVEITNINESCITIMLYKVVYDNEIQ